MLIACWSAKGGSGVTVIAASLALLLARQGPPGAVLADLDGDAAAVLGLPEEPTAGLAGWLAAGEDVPADALARLEVQVAPGLALLPRGSGPLATGRIAALLALWEGGHRPVVVDCGNLTKQVDPAVATPVARAADRSLLVIRPCYLSLCHATRAPVRPTGAIAVTQPGRPMGHRDVERALDVPVVCRLAEDPVVSRAVDAGLTAQRVPRSLARGLRHVV